jgi:hypothetical protein
MLIRFIDLKGSLAVAKRVGAVGAIAVLWCALGGSSRADQNAAPSPQAPAAPAIVPLRLGIVNRPGLFAAREIFYEDRGGRAVVGDMVVGDSAALHSNLVKELVNLSSFVAANPPPGLDDGDKNALAGVKAMLGVARAGTPEDNPDVQHLIEAAARLPYDALGLDAPFAAELDRLLDTATGEKILDQLRAGDLWRVRKMMRTDDKARDQAKAALYELAQRAGYHFLVNPRGDEPGAPVIKSVKVLSRQAGDIDASPQFKRIAALATFAKDFPGFTPEAKMHLAMLAAKAQGSVHENGSPYVGPKSPSVVARGFYVDDRSLYWDQGVIPYKFAPDFAADFQKTVKQAMQDYLDHTAITFKPQSNETAYVVFKVTGSNLSQVGCQRAEQTIELETTPRVGATIHEIGHALGLLHEHTRPDRDKSIKVLFDQVKDDASRMQFNAINGLRTQTLGKYDFTSIMHYPPDAFGALQGAGLAITMEKADGSPLGPEVGDLGPNGHLSPKDIGSLAIMYGAKP